MPISFGTGGLRGIMGEGAEHFSTQIVKETTRGIALWLLSILPERTLEKGVAIAYDTRNYSAEYAELAAHTLASCGVPAHLFARPTPTPVLSFAVRHLGCAAGIVITASHNPKEYNGYKVYNAQGHQLVPYEADALMVFIARVRAGQSTNAPERDVHTISPAVDEAFLAAIAGQSLYSDCAAKADLKIVYTPLHGTGDWFVREALARDGFTQVSPVTAQQVQDGNFPTVKSPNPEDRNALTLGIEQARASGAQIVLGTDPDCDRVGVAALHNGEYHLISGNQMGALLMAFILENHPNLPANGAVVKTIVTNDLGASLARDAGFTVFETLTGFKYIGEKICEFEASGEYTFLFGYEESYGYLMGTHARDKDAVIAAQLICEMAAWHKAHQRTLIDALQVIYTKYQRVYIDALDTKKMSDMAVAEQLIAALRSEGDSMFSVPTTMYNYLEGIAGLPRENVLKFVCDDGDWLAIRPSGTEPILKIYYSVQGKTQEEAESVLATMRREIGDLIDQA